MDPDHPTNPYAPTSSISELDPYAVLRDQTPVEEVNPCVSIWLRPRVTIRWIVHTNPLLHVWLLAALAGIVQALDNAEEQGVGDSLELPMILVLAATVGPIGGIIYLVLYSALVKWTGNWLGGIAKFVEIRAALAWAALPSVASLLLWAIQLGVLGDAVFQPASQFGNLSPVQGFVAFVVGIGEIVLGVWYVVLASNTVAEVQGYHSAWRGLGNLMLPGIVILVPLILVGIFFALF